MTEASFSSPMLLGYSMETDPDPIQVDKPVKLTFVVSGPAPPPSPPPKCTVSQIQIKLPVGDAKDATNLTAVAPSESDVSITSSDADKDHPNWTRSAGQSAGLFIFTPPGGSVLFGDQSLTIEVAGIQVSPLVGTPQIIISEWAAPGSSPPPAPKKAPSGQIMIPAPKFPEGFHASGLTPSKAQVDPGETVTLTWLGSDNADYSMTYGGQGPTRVTGRSWTSPPLYTTTVFILTASATEGGQTVELHLTTGVTVGNPEVQEFSATPSQIDYNQPVTLNWRAINADSVCLITGQTDQASLPAVPDPANPATLVPDPDQPHTLRPAYGVSYELQAHKGQLVSAPFPLAYTFNHVVIESFAADPPTVAAGRPTKLSWDVRGAKSVSYQEQDVPASSSTTEKPASDTTYNLVATWVNDSKVQATPVHVTVLNVPVDSRPSWTGKFTGTGKSQQLLFHSSGQRWGLGAFTGTSLSWIAANTALPGKDYAQGDSTWVGDIDGSGKSQVLFWHPGDQNWWLGTFAGTSLYWSGLPSSPFYSPGDHPTWAAHFTDMPPQNPPFGKNQLLFWHPGDQHWWLGAFWGGLVWIQAGAPPSGTNYTQSDPTWAADFTGTGKSQILFCFTGDQNWWLGTFTGTSLSWTQAGDTRGFGYDPGNHPTWIGDFTGTGKSQVLFCFTGDQNWWLGTFTGTSLSWAPAGNTGRIGHYQSSHPTWVADFTGSGKSQILFYSPDDASWWLGTFSGTTLGWTRAA